MDRHDTALLDLLLRIVAVIVVVARAKSRNRTAWIWGILAFVLPIPCLIAIWFVKRKKVAATPSQPTVSSAKAAAPAVILPAPTPPVATRPVFIKLSEVDRTNHKLILAKLAGPAATIILGDILMPRREYEDLVINLGPGRIAEERATINSLVKAIFTDKSKGLRVFDSEEDYRRFITSYFPSHPSDAGNTWFRAVAIPLSHLVTESEAIRFLDQQSVSYSIRPKPATASAVASPPVVKAPASPSTGTQTLPAKKASWLEFQKLLQQHNITKLYHFTDRANLSSIRSVGGLLSWYSCQQRGIEIPRPGGSQLSWNLDAGKGLGDYVRLSFTPNHPMMYVAQNDGRINSPVVLEIDPQVIFWESTRFSTMNAAKSGVGAAGSLEMFAAISFPFFKRRYYDLSPEEKSRFQAEILIHQMLPAEYIINLNQLQA